MKNIIKLVSIFFLLITTNIYALTLETMDRAIINSSEPMKQSFKCQREVKWFKKNGNPEICIKASKAYSKIYNPNNEEKEELGRGYYNAGIMYTFGEKYKDYKKAFKMYKLSYESGYGEYSSSVMTKIGYFYRNGWGVDTNKILAYKYYLEAAKAGNQNAQGNLDLLCKESPWACK